PAVQEPRTHPGGAGRDRGPAAALIASAPAPAAIGAIAGERLSRQTYPREGGGQPVESPPGGMPERTKGHAWRACRRVTVSGVQIPVPPPKELFAHVNAYTIRPSAAPRPTGWPGVPPPPRPVGSAGQGKPP